MHNFKYALSILAFASVVLAGSHDDEHHDDHHDEHHDEAPCAVDGNYPLFCEQSEANSMTLKISPTRIISTVTLITCL